MISLDTFRSVAANSKIGKNEALTFSDDDKTVICGLNGQKRSIKAANDVELKQNTIYLRSSLLTGIRDKLGLADDSPTFKKFEKLIFGDLVNGRFDADTASKPLAKREIKMILSELDAATKERYKAETFSLDNGMDYAKHKNQVGIVFSFSKSGSPKARQFFEKCLNFKVVNSSGYINKVADEHLTKSKSGGDLINLGIVSSLNDTKGLGAAPESFMKDVMRTSGGFGMPDGTTLKPQTMGKKVPAKEVNDLFTEKLTKGRVKHYDDLVGKDLKFVQFAMSMMNQRTVGPLSFLEQTMMNDESRFLMMTKPKVGYQVSINDDGSVTFRGFTHGDVMGVANAMRLLVPTDTSKSGLCYSYEITYSAEKLDQILEHDWNDPSPDWVKPDKREFYFTCHLEG